MNRNAIPKHLLAALVMSMLIACGQNKETESKAEEANAATTEQSVSIVSPLNGEAVQSPFTVKFAAKGMAIVPAGTQQPNSGHHHLLINLAELPPMDQPLPSTDQIRHFGKGQTKTELSLPPGQHTLQLLLGDYAHRPHDKPLLSEKITILVVQ